MLNRDSSVARQGCLMDEWHYDHALYLEPALLERLQAFRLNSTAAVHGARWLGAVVLRTWLRLYHRFAIIGRENLPLDRPFVMIANHASHLDTICLLSALPLSRLSQAFPAAAKDYFCKSALRKLVATVFVNAIPFERHLAPWHSLSACAYVLEKGNILILFPEGTRGSEDEPGEFKPGVALITAGRDIPIVPCHLAGTREALPRGAWIPWPGALRLTIGKPRVYAHLPATKASARRICQELREAVVLLGQPPFSNREVP
jgi:1-acyl-sn-glycerol-3-phosphate acyltransferase